MTKYSQEGCRKDASFNFKDDKKLLYCKSHKITGMINIKSKKCEYEGCNIINPAFNNKGEIKGKFCFSHKSENMINVVSKKM